jgi:hypothetical protein
LRLSGNGDAMSSPDEFDFSKLLDTGSLVQSHEALAPPASGSMPFMITHAQKSRLSSLGHSEEAIARMKPEVAHQLLIQSKS